MATLETTLWIALGLIAFFIVFPMVLGVVFDCARILGLLWINSIGWWWNYWLV